MNIKEAMQKRAEHLIRSLAPRAEKGNSYWKRVEALQGYEGDYSISDIDGGDSDPRSTK